MWFLADFLIFIYFIFQLVKKYLKTLLKAKGRKYDNRLYSYYVNQIQKSRQTKDLSQFKWITIIFQPVKAMRIEKIWLHKLKNITLG